MVLSRLRANLLRIDRHGARWTSGTRRVRMRSQGYAGRHAELVPQARGRAPGRQDDSLGVATKNRAGTAHRAANGLNVESRDLAATDSRVAQRIKGVGPTCMRFGSVLGAQSAKVDRCGSTTTETSIAPCRLPDTRSCKRRSIGQPSADHPVQANGAQTHRERAVRCRQHACCSSGSWPLGCLGEGRALLAPCSLRSRLQNQEVSPWRRELPAGALGQ